MSRFRQCPAGHPLPHETSKGQCTPVRCAEGKKPAKPATTPADEVQAKVKRAARKMRTDVAEVAEEAAATPHDDVRELVPALGGSHEDVALQSASAEHAEHVGKLGRSAGRLAARRAFLKVPTGLTGADAEAYADKKLVDLLPFAVAEYEYQLLFGDEGQRERAAAKILDATGRGKREASAQANSPIIIVNAGGNAGVQSLPWVQGHAKVVSAPAPVPSLAAGIGAALPAPGSVASDLDSDLSELQADDAAESDGDAEGADA